MTALELAKELAGLAPAVLYLAGVIYLYRRNEKQAALFLEKMEKLLERYHQLVLDNTKAFLTISEELKDK